jgi:hypothetical protein
VFKSYETVSESSAVRAIRMAAECFGPMGGEKNGCRQDWLGSLSLTQKNSMFSSYRSNRFNNLFQNSTAFLFHMHDIQVFVSQYSPKPNLKLQSVIAEVKDSRIINDIAVLSFLHIFFTDPY